MSEKIEETIKEALAVIDFIAKSLINNTIEIKNTKDICLKIIKLTICKYKALEIIRVLDDVIKQAEEILNQPQQSKN